MARIRSEVATADRHHRHDAELRALKALQTHRTLCRRCQTLPATVLFNSVRALCRVCHYAERGLTATQRRRQMLSEAIR